MTALITRTTLLVIALMSSGAEFCFAGPTDCSQRLAIGGRAILPDFLPRRSAVERTMHHADFAVREALMILGQAVNPVLVVGRDEIHEIYARAGVGAPPAGLNAFRAPADLSDANIYVNRDSVVYANAARKPSALTALQLAATLAHEQVHNTDGDVAAYRLQSDFVRNKLSGLPRRQQEGARRYLSELDARARALERAEQLRRPTARADS